MARLSIEDKWWTDPRRFRLAELIGDNPANPVLADAVMLPVWYMSQQFWKSGRKKIPESVFKTLNQHQAIFDADLAVKHGSFVYVRGTRQFHEWLALVVEAGSKGGKTIRNKRSPSEAIAKPSTSSREASYSSSSSCSVSSSVLKQDKECQLQLESPQAAQPAGAGLPLLAKIWNEEAKTLPKVKASNAARNRRIEARYQENPDPSYWREVIRKVTASAFCRGKNDRGWRATFDWLLQPETHLKVTEGKYDLVSPQGQGSGMRYVKSEATSG